MIEEQDAVCRLIIQQLKEIPVWKLFSDQSVQQIPKTINKPITFEIIESKLDHHVYPNSDAWVAEMRRFFMNEIENSAPNSIRKNSAILISQKFEKLMETLAPGLSPHIISVQATEEKLYKIYESMITADPDVQITKTTKPASRVFADIEKEGDDVTPQMLIHKMRLLRFPELLLRAIAFVHKYQPECIVYGDTLSINFSLLSKENMAKLNEFINKLMLDAATGKIDPMKRVSGTDISPTELRSV